MDFINELSLGDIINQTSDLVVEYTFSVVGALLILVIGFIIAGLVKRSVKSGLAKLKHSDPTLNSFLSNVARYGVLIVVGVAVLGQFGIETASILAALGAAGLAIGLALQGTLQNIAAGVMLLMLRPFRAGEYIDADGIDGTVTEIGLFATEMKTLDGKFVLTPNSQLWNVPVTNYSRLETRRFDLEVGIGYDDDIEQTEELLMKLAGEEDRVLKDPAPVTFVSSLGDSAVVVTLRYWTKTPDWWMTSREMTKRAKLACDDAGISIPFPQRDLHIISQPSADEAA